MLFTKINLLCPNIRYKNKSKKVGMIKEWISNLLHKTRFWNNIRHVHPKPQYWKVNTCNSKVFGGKIRNPKWLNRMPKSSKVVYTWGKITKYVMVWLDTNPRTRIKNGAKYINSALFYVYEITKHHGKKGGAENW